MAYSVLATPLGEGGLSCPSLVDRQGAYDLKFLGDLISGPQSVPWKAWTWFDLKHALFASSWKIGMLLNPLLQQAHTIVCRLQPRVRAMFLTAQLLGWDITSCFPLWSTTFYMPVLYHPAL